MVHRSHRLNWRACSFITLLAAGFIFTTSAALIRKCDFENGFKGLNEDIRVHTEGGKVTVVSDPAGGSGHAAKCVKGSKRAEVAYYHKDPVPGERWYGWKLYLPKGEKGGIITQWHRWQDCMNTGKCGWAKGNPMHLNGGGSGNYSLHYSYGGSGSRKNPSLKVGANASNDHEKWVQWAFHVKWARKSDGGGFMKLYHNGKLVLDHTGPNWMELPIGPAFKAGLYYRGGTIYVDDFVIGDENSSLAEVSLQNPATGIIVPRRIDRGRAAAPAAPVSGLELLDTRGRMLITPKQGTGIYFIRFSNNMPSPMHARPVISIPSR